MKTGTLTLVALGLILALANTAHTDVIKPLVLGDHDSGWDAILTDDVNSGVIVDVVGDDYVIIEITKIFHDAPSGGVFTPNLIGFRQRLDDANTVATIRIADEFILNDTGTEWTDYHWEIVGDAAAFDMIATDAGGFSISPFTVKSWGPAQTGWDANHPATLDVSGGVVSSPSVYMPGSSGGSLYIDVDLSLAESDFTLKQTPTPEPGTLALLVLGGSLILARRRRRLATNS
jgi:hypothetical protein